MRSPFKFAQHGRCGMWLSDALPHLARHVDDIALVPGTVTVNPNEVDVSWELCGRRIELPILAAA